MSQKGKVEKKSLEKYHVEKYCKYKEYKGMTNQMQVQKEPKEKKWKVWKKYVEEYFKHKRVQRKG